MEVLCNALDTCDARSYMKFQKPVVFIIEMWELLINVGGIKDVIFSLGWLLCMG